MVNLLRNQWSIYSEIRCQFDRLFQASLTEMERSLIMGKLSGRKPKMTPDKLKAAKKLLEGGIPPKEVAKTLEISIATLYR